jgi:apolipoprotein N-acyltransferase
LVDLARLGGPLLLTAGVWTGGVVVSTLVRAVGTPGQLQPRPAASSALALLVGLGALVVVGALSPGGGAPVRTISVALVQGGGARGLDKAEVPPADVFNAQVAASLALLTARRAPDLVLWPEDVIALAGPLSGSHQAKYVSQLARRLHSTVVAGVTEPASTTTFRNEIVAWGPNGKIVGTFEKVHRVPFGEYVPLRSLIAHVANLSEVPADAVPGHGSGLLRTPAGPLGTLVSFEVFYASRSRTSVRAGAQLLIVPTNTSSYSTSQIPTQELAADVIQAVETGRDLVQASPTGYSSVVTSRGQVLQRSVLGRRQVLTASVPLRRGFTPYDHLGDMPVILLALGALALGWRRQRRWSDQS